MPRTAFYYPTRRLATLFAALAAPFLLAAELQDPSLATAGQPGSPWTSTGLDAKGSEAASLKRAGDVTRLRSATRQPVPAGLTQTVDLPAGLYEWTVQASGSGRLTLAVGDAERTLPLGQERGLYGLLVDWAGGQAACAIRVAGSADLAAAAIAPATPDQKAAWQRSRQDLAQFGYVTVSPQRPPPGKPAPMAVDAQPLDAMAVRAVFYDDRLEFVHVKHMLRLVDWLGDNGFSRLDANEIRYWMLDRIDAGAYGSVVVMPMGVGPQELNRKPGKEALWFRYLAAGGRIVWIGNPPFYVFQSAAGEPPVRGTPALSTLGLTWGWGQEFWGANRPVTLTGQGKAWGLERSGHSVTGYSAEEVSIAFSEYTTAQTGRRGATTWMINLRPDLPWSGIIAYQQGMDANDDASMRDVWRLAHYLGKPVDIPALPPKDAPPPPPAIDVTTNAAGLPGRTQFVRGEGVTIIAKPARAGVFDEIRATLLQDGVALTSLTGADAVQLDTAPYAYGDYQLRIDALRDGQLAGYVDLPVGIRHLRHAEFGFDTWAGIPTNPRQAEVMMANYLEADMDLTLGDVSTPEQMDWALRYNRRFSQRIHARPDQKFSFKEHPECFILDANGGYRRHGSGRYCYGLTDPKLLAYSRRDLTERAKGIARHPAFNNIMMTNDDFSSLHYGFDYSRHVVDKFKAETGLDAPAAATEHQPGVVPDNDPWILWNLFTLREVDGNWNQMQKEAVTAADPDIRIGPIPGGMQIPAIHMWKAGQYPPYSFGEHGHNLLCFYYYNSFWQPPIANTVWCEAVRMGNRDLPLWVMPDCMAWDGYTRNNFFHLMAGGVDGLAYFIYGQRTAESWAELGRLSHGVRRIEPVQVRLRPTGRRVALMHSVTSDMFSPANWLMIPYAYSNLAQAHYDVDIIAEEEVLAGICAKYDAVLLYRTTHLRQSVYDALAKQAAAGANILLDRSVPFDIPGCKRIDVDLGMGAGLSQDMPPEGAHAATPGPGDYDVPERVRVVGEAMAKVLPPFFTGGDAQLVAVPFSIGDVRYAWFVNCLDKNSYLELRGAREKYNADANAKVQAWYDDEFRRHPTCEATVRMTATPGVPYDLWRGGRLPEQDGAIQLTMDRLGGTLVAFLPQALTGLDLAAPASAVPLQPVTFTATVKTADGPSAATTAVRFELTDPDGHRSPVSTVLAVEKGSCQLTWTPAVNDLAGTWRLVATDLAGGFRAEAAVKLAPATGE